MSTLEVTPNVRTGRYLTREQRQAIAAAVASGRTQTSVAADFGVTSMTVSRIMKEVQSVQRTVTDWRAAQTQRAVDAVDAGLTHDADPYKRADLGIKVLTGLQVYRPAVDVSHSVNLTRDLPSDWRGKWITAYDDDDVSPNASAGESDTSPKP